MSKFEALYILFQSDVDNMEPTSDLPNDITQSKGEENEQGSNAVNDADVSDCCFEHEEHPFLKITKVETIEDSEVS